MATKMFVIEQPLPNYWRRFIIDCPHATTTHDHDNWPKPDAARASGLIDRMLKAHRAQVLELEKEVCECRPERPS